MPVWGGKPAQRSSDGLKDCFCRRDMCVLLALSSLEAYDAGFLHDKEGSAIALVRLEK